MPPCFMELSLWHGTHGSNDLGDPDTCATSRPNPILLGIPECLARSLALDEDRESASLVLGASTDRAAWRHQPLSRTVVHECLVGAAGLVAQARARGHPRGHADTRHDREDHAR